MLSNYCKRTFAFLLALAMVFSAVPVQAFSTETDEHIHSYTARETVAETCGAAGYTVYTCACGDSYHGDEVAATGAHSYADEVIPPTAEAQGYTLHTCKVCGDTYQDTYTDPVVEETGSALLQQLRSEIASFIDKYRLEPDMSDGELANVFIYLNSQQAMDCWNEMNAILERAKGLTAAEGDILLAEGNTQLAQRFYDVIVRLNSPVMLADDFYPVSGIAVSVAGGTVQDTNNGVSVSVTGTGSGCNTSSSTATITVTNDSGKNVELSFDWTAQYVKTLTIKNESESGASGNSKVPVAAGDNFTITVESNAGSSATATFTMSNFTVKELAENFAVTFGYDATLGSITVGDTPVPSGTPQEVSSNGVALVATPNSSDVTFLGWTDSDGKRLSTDGTYKLTPSKDMTVKAVFAKDGGNAVFATGTTASKSAKEGLLGNTFNYWEVTPTNLFDNLGDAIAAAESGSSKTIVLMNNGTISDRYTIPSGVTLLIPFDDANSLYKTNPVAKNAGQAGAHNAYRTLTMASGANLTIEGEMSVSATIYAAGGSKRGSGTPLTNYGYVKMQSGSSITVENGGGLYCYGYINGSGKVTANSGAAVYETFQFEDFRGGTVTSSMATDDYRVFPLSDYYVQNIMVPLTLNVGASEYSYAALNMSSATFGTSVKFIGTSNTNDVMFNLTSGSVTKQYDASRDRLVFNADGDVKIAGIKMSISNISMSSSDFELPINSNMTININSGSISLQQNVALLPGAEVNVSKDANCTLVNGASLFLYDSDDWGPYVGAGKVRFLPLSFVPERTYTMKEADLKDAQINIYGSVTASGNVYTTSSGAAIKGAAEGATVIMTPPTSGTTYQYVQDGDYEDYKYSLDNGKLASAMLQNADGSYYKTADTPKDAEGNYIYGSYVYDGSVWNFKCTTHTPDDDATCIMSQTCKVCGTVMQGAGGHSYDEGVVTKAATCTEDGNIRYTCSVCPEDTDGHYKDETITALGHSEETMPAVKATCYATGLTEGTKCNREGCGVILKEQTVTDKVDHIWAFGKWIETPTCTEFGEREVYCIVCQDAGRDEATTELVPPAGHTMEKTEANDATCQATGNKEYYFCGTCEKFFWDEAGEDPLEEGETVVISQLPHDYETTVTKDATCTEKGSQTTACTYGCGVNTKTEEIPAKGHNTTLTAASAATCTTAGSKEYYVCGTCQQKSWDKDGNNVITDESTIVMAALSHNWGAATYTWSTDNSLCTCTRTCTRTDCGERDIATVTTTSEVTKAATCTENGTTTYTADFDNTDEAIADQTKTVTISALGHEYGEVTYEWKELAGQWHSTASRSCTRDGCTSSETEEKEATAETTDATCTDAGKTVYTVDFEKIAFETQTKEVEIPAKGHDWNVTDYTWGEDNATCTATRTCKTDENHVETETVDSTSKTTKEASCEIDGETTFTATFETEGFGTKTTTTPIAQTGHDYTFEDTTQPTCTGTGVRTYTCKNDSTHTYTETIDALGHSFTNYVANNDATCTEDGTETATCDRCTATDKRTIADSKLGHDLQKVDAKVATCLADGNSEYWFCQRCELVFEDENASQETTVTAVTLPKLDHDYDAVVTAPTCLEDGYTTHTCQNGCGGSYTDTKVNATGHSYDKGEVTTQPTCNDQGVKTFTCTNDGCTEDTEGHSYTEDVAALGHHYVLSEEKSTEAGCVTEGENVYICNRCKEGTEGHSYAEKVDASGHDWYTKNATPATCMQEGWTGDAWCPNCGQRTDGEVIPKTEHQWNGGTQTQKPTCTQAEEWTYTCTTAGCGTTKVETMSMASHDTTFMPAKEATCTETGNVVHYICENCQNTFEDSAGTKVLNDVTIKATGHTTTMTPAKAATCLADGNLAYYTCQKCQKLFEDVEGQKETTLEAVTIRTPGHEYEGVVTAPTCTEKGYTTYSCIRGDQSYVDDDVDALGHDYDSEVTLEPTCTGTGIRTYTCKNDSAHTYTEDVDALGHSFTNYVSNGNATCTKDGTETAQCDRCTEKDTRTEENSALGHEYEEVVTDPTCTEKGYTTYSCIRGDYSYVDDDVDALGHTEEIDEAVPPTCTSAGLTEGSHCSVCEETLVEQKVAPATGHTPAEPVEANRIEASCTENGSYEEVVYCSVCSAEISRDKKVIEATGHTEVTDPAVVPTCTTAGKTEGKHCSVCEEVLVKQENVDALGHTEVIDPAVAATCTETGLTEGKHCSVCEETLIPQVEVAAKGHTEATDPAVAATCTETGLTEGKHCSVCQEVLTKQTEVPAKGHTEVIDPAVAATCTTAGKTEGKHCSVCQEVLTKQEKVEALGHTEVIDPAVAATCTETGLTEGKHCSVCSAEIVKQETIPAKDHTEAINPAVAATCTETGKTEGKYCSVCNEVLVAQTEVKALGHTEVIDPAVAATCTTAGKTEGKHCSVCNETLVAQEEVAMLGHMWDQGRVTTVPTCSETGIRIFTCSVCYAIKEEEEAKLDHVLVQIEAKKPTYTSPGWDAYEYCEECDYNTMVSIPALGEPEITTFDEFIENLRILEDIADIYVKKVSPGKDPAMLVIKYIRTGVDRYNSGSWNIMAGYEDADFAAYVRKYEDAYNLDLEEGAELMKVSGMKNLNEFYLPNGDFADIGHVFGSMDITYTNKNSEDHADVSGWAGDTVDLMSLADQFGLEATTVEDMVNEINRKYFLKYEEDFNEDPEEGTFSNTDVEGDLDAFYVMQTLYSREYENGTLADIFSSYMNSSLTSKKRAQYFLNNRLDGVSLRTDVRDAVYNEYLANGVVATLENTRPFKTADITSLRKACCYVFADYLCKLAGDFVEIEENEYFSVFQSETSTLAPGIVQKINYANTADGKTMVYYLATGDITRSDVNVYANYNNNDPGQGWAMQRVIDQANAAQEKYGNPESDHYIENYNVIASINGDGYDMYTGEPGGLLVMDGHEWHACDGNGFFAILSTGEAVIGTQAEYNALKAEGKVKEAIGAFGTSLVKDGKINVTATSNYFTDRASRTAIGITATGKVVFMVLDGRQGDLSCGGSMAEIAQIMLEAGCVEAVNLDGGGSSTYVAKEAGETALSVVSKPSDGISRSVSTSLLMVSTAPSSTAFDHAVVESAYTYFTANSSGKFTATAVSATGNVVDMPEGVVWTVSDESIGSVDADGVFTAKANGTVYVQLKLDGEVIGSKKVNVVDPDNVYFEKEALNAIYGEPKTLPVKAVYEGKEVAINEADVVLSVEKENAGTIDGFVFTGNEESGLKKIKVTAALACDPSVTAIITLSMFTKDEASFDFDGATGGDLQLAWIREVSNAEETIKNVYYALDKEKDMETTYTFAMDMSKIDVPQQLADLTYMLPGADVEGNNTAWSFLLQLAERVSVLTEVTPVLYFDKDMDVDYSGLTINNEYFYLKEAVFNEEENSLALVMKWHKQDKPIDPDTANPMCVVTGIKLTPKDDAGWNSNDVLAVINKGKINYDIYLRANALYSFSCKPENQEIYGLYPFENPDNENEKGGHFNSVYKEFEDQYTLNNGIKDGWVIEGGGFAYYENGAKYTGIREVDGYYYDFGDNGVNLGQKKYTGNMTDANGDEFYLVDGLKYTGWMVLDMKNVRYYNPETGVREILSEDEVPSTCIIDGYCIYTSESGAIKRVDYDDAGGHEYVEQADHSYVCSVCGYVRIEMEDVTVKLSYNVCTYTGTARTPATTATAADGRVLTKSGQSDYPDYYSTYSNNVDVGTASVELTASKYGKYSNLNTWRGNAAGSITVTYEIRPDLPTNVKLVVKGDKAVISWSAAKAPEVTYVVYASNDGKTWTEMDETTDLSYTMNMSKATGKFFKIGTRKVVSGQTYDSLNRSGILSVVTSAPVVIVDNNTDGKPVLEWTALEGAEQYKVYRSDKKDGSYVYVFNTTGQTYTHISAVAGNTYFYYVKAIMKDGSEVKSEIVSGTCIVPTESFEITTGNNTEGKPTLKWNAMTDADHYEVYRFTTENGSYVKVFTTAGRTYTHASATAGKTYYYKVKIVYQNGTEQFSYVVKNYCHIPGVVFNIVAGHNAEGKPTLKWTAIPGADHYEVYRSDAKNGTYIKAFTTKGTTYTNSSAKAGNTYYYKLKVYLTDGTEAVSDILENFCGIPDAVFNIVTGHNAEGKPTLKWTAISGADHYEIYRANESDGDYIMAFSTKGTTYTNASAKAGSTYYYKFKVYLVDGTEATSDIVVNNCTIPNAKFEIATGHNAEGKPTLKWTAIPGADHYEVYRANESDGDYVMMFTTKGTTYTNTSAKVGKTYYYKLKVYLVDGTDATSEIFMNVCLSGAE